MELGNILKICLDFWKSSFIVLIKCIFMKKNVWSFEKDYNCLWSYCCYFRWKGNKLTPRGFIVWINIPRSP